MELVLKDSKTDLYLKIIAYFGKSVNSDSLTYR